MSSPEHYRMDTPYQTRENTPRQTPFRTHEEEANAAEEMLRENTEAQLARQLKNLNLVPEASPPSSSYVMNVLSRGIRQSADKAARKLNFDIVEDSPDNQMISRASGSNDPPQPPTTLDTNTDPTYWTSKKKPYIIAQLKTSGWDPPHPDIHKLNKDELLEIFFKWRNIKPNEESHNSTTQQPLKSKRNRPKKPSKQATNKKDKILLK